MKERFYNVWYHSGKVNHWAYANDRWPGHNPENPKRMTLKEAQAFQKELLAQVSLSNSEYIVLEMDVNGKPIFPPCREDLR